jgi:AraC-like DNA-binding protein
VLKKKDLSAHIEVDEVAEMVNLSASRLRAIFKAETRLTLPQYLKKLRLERARELAETTHLRACEIMNELQVTDYSHFLRDFRKEYGMSLTECRKKPQNTGAESTGKGPSNSPTNSQCGS